MQIRGKRNAKTNVFVAPLISRSSEAETGGELSGTETDLTTTTYQAQRHNFLLLLIYQDWTLDLKWTFFKSTRDGWSLPLKATPYYLFFGIRIWNKLDLLNVDPDPD